MPKLALIADDEKLAKAYWHSWYCTASIAEYADGTISAWYCKRRWCPVCNAIRTAQVISRLTPVFDSWNERYFVTLTQGTTVTGEALRPTIAAMQQNFTRCKDRGKKRSQRKDGAKFVGIRKLEVTYNVRDNRFHPHYHALLNSEETAQNLMMDWLSLNPGASPNAQHVTPANNGSLVELSKYMTKLTATDSKGNRQIYVDGLHTMFQALNGVRTLQTFGFTLPAIKEATGEAKAVDPIGKYQWISQLSDWGDMETGELLSGYVPSEAMKQVIDSIVVSPNYNQYG